MEEGCFSSYVTGQLDIIEGRMNATKYKDKLNKNLLTSVNALKKMVCNCSFQQAVNPDHNVIATKQWF